MLNDIVLAILSLSRQNAGSSEADLSYYMFWCSVRVWFLSLQLKKTGIYKHDSMDFILPY